MSPPPPRSTLFPYTTLFRSVGRHGKFQPPRNKRLHRRAHHRGSAINRQMLKGIILRPQIQADRKSTRLNSSHLGISYAVFCLKKKKERRAESRRQSQITHRD